MTKVLFPSVYRLAHEIIAIENIGGAERHSKEDRSVLNPGFYFSQQGESWLKVEGITVLSRTDTVNGLSCFDTMHKGSRSEPPLFHRAPFYRAD